MSLHVIRGHGFILCRALNLLVLCNRKTASTSVEKAMRQSFLAYTGDDTTDANTHGGSECIERIASNLDLYLIVSVVRSPLARLISGWRERITPQGVNLARPHPFTPGIAFNDCARLVIDTPDEALDRHFQSQMHLLAPNRKFLPNLLLRHERLDKDWPVFQEMCRKHCGMDIANLTHQRPSPGKALPMVDMRLQEQVARRFDLDGKLHALTLSQPWQRPSYNPPFLTPVR